jgi:predicted MFS family arabinose efflux permease
MVGIAFSGMGIGILIVGPTAQYFISQFGWRTAYMLLGLMVLLLLVPLNCIQQNWPGEKKDHSKQDSSSPSTKIYNPMKRFQ